MTAEEYYEKGSALYELWIRNDDRSGLKESLHYINMAIGMKPDYADAYWKRAHVCRSNSLQISNDAKSNFMSDINRSLILYQAMLERDMQDPVLHYKLGLVYQDLHDYKKALFHLRKALKLNPSYAEACAAIGFIYNRVKRRYKRALEYYNRAIELDGSSFGYYMWRGNCFERLRQYDRALDDYNTGMAMESSEHYTGKRRAELYLKLQMWDEAMRDFKAFRSNDPSSRSPFLGFRQNNRGGPNFQLYISSHGKEDSWWINDMVFLEFMWDFSTKRKRFNYHGPTNVYSGRELKRIGRKLEDHLRCLESISKYSDFLSHVIETEFVDTLIRKFDDPDRNWPEYLELMEAANRHLVSMVTEAESMGEALYIEGI